MNTLHLSCENPDELLAGFGAGARISIQSAAVEAGPFGDIDTVDLLSGIRSYTYEHGAGLSSDWYQVRFEDATGVNFNDWSDPFQVGDETGGLLCSVEDVWQRMNGNASMPANEGEILLEVIRGVSDEIEDYCGRWLAPRPTYAAGTMTLLLDVDWPGRDVLVQQGHRVCGVRTVTALGVATMSQPQTGGSYTAATLADVFIRPLPTSDGPGTRLVMSDIASTWFYPGYNTVSVTGSFGPASVAPRIQEVAISAVTRRYLGKERAEPMAFTGGDGSIRILSDISPGGKATLDRLRWPLVA